MANLPPIKSAYVPLPDAFKGIYSIAYFFYAAVFAGNLCLPRIKIVLCKVAITGGTQRGQK